MSEAVVRACAAVRAALASSGVEWEQPTEHSFVVSLPGEHKLTTTASLVVGAHSLSVNAFVARRPDENVPEVHRWLLERNRRTYAVAFALDQHGDVYLSGRLPLGAVDEVEVDRILGAVLEYADGSFDTLLEMGFAGSIRREWEWRARRGHSVENLRAFAHFADPERT